MDTKSFIKFYQSYYNDLIRYTTSLTGNQSLSEDILQDAVYTALKNLDFLPVGISFRSWMFASIRFNWSRYKREKLQETASSGRYLRLNSPLSVGDDPASDKNLRPWKETVLNAINSLPELYRRPVVLFEIFGVSHQRVAEVENTYPGTIKSRLYRARKILRRRLREYAHVENIPAQAPENDPTIIEGESKDSQDLQGH